MVPIHKNCCKIKKFYFKAIANKYLHNIKFPISQRNREFQLPELRFVKDVHLLEDA
ncbi:hypothetical protein H1Q63_07540 [Desmonostoc muscorum CCALA 125]|nr:hypothetical protein [Desmonostoc muscorum CCALA 125]